MPTWLEVHEWLYRAPEGATIGDAMAAALVKHNAESNPGESAACQHGNTRYCRPCGMVPETRPVGDKEVANGRRD